MQTSQTNIPATSDASLSVAQGDNADAIANQLADAIFPNDTAESTPSAQVEVEDTPEENSEAVPQGEVEDGEDDDSQAQENPEDENDEDQNEEEADEPSEDDDSDDIATNEKFSPAQQKAFNKAIGKSKQKYKDAKAQLDTAISEKSDLQSKLDALQVQYNDLELAKAVPAPSADNPLAGQINSLEELQSFTRAQFDLKDEILKNTSEEGDSFVFSDGKDVQLDADRVRSLLSKIERTISLDIPAHREFLKGDTEANSWLSALPDFSQKNSELNNAITAALVKIPALKTVKGSKRAAYHLAIGERLAARYGAESWNVACNGTIPTAPAAKAKLKRVPPKPITKKEAPVTTVTSTKKAMPKIETAQDAESFIASVI